MKLISRQRRHAPIDFAPRGCDAPVEASADVKVRRTSRLEAHTEPVQYGVWKTVFWRRGMSPAKLTWCDAIKELRSDCVEFRELLGDVLRATPSRAFFWECSPTSLASQGESAFEFVTLDAPSLSMHADRRPFWEHIGRHAGQPVALTFPNLGGDSLLIAPAEATRDGDYAHFAAFLRTAPAAQVDAIWRKLGEALECQLRESRSEIWVNSDGRTVAWMHLRLDSSSKYYRWAPYCQPQPVGEGAFCLTPARRMPRAHLPWTSMSSC